MSKIYGITGGIATGKSFISQIIKDAGYQVYNGDEIAHQIGDMKEIMQTLSAIFGSAVIKNDHLNRALLGKIVFENEQELAKLNAVMLPVIKKKIIEIIDKTHASVNKKNVFIEIPLLFELGYDKYLDGTIVVTLDRDIQLKRLMKRDNIEANFAEKKISAQMSLMNKIKMADFVVNNSEKKEIVEQKVKQLLTELNTNL